MPLSKNAGSKLQAAKTPRAPPGLGTLVSDPVVTEVDVGHRTVGLQHICECLSGEQRGPGASYRISVTVKARAFHRAEHLP